MRLIDTRHLGHEHVIGCWELDRMLVDPGPTTGLETLLGELDAPPRALLLTHIHLDHAGATGTLIRRFPEIPVYVHERGARHLADPSKLLASAGRLYGEEMERLWGEVAPVPEGNLRPLSGGEMVEGFRVADAPGHASHHVLYFHTELRCAFAGDVAGVRIGDSGYVVPPTPPPDIDVEAWNRSLDALLGFEPETIAITHFGLIDDPEAHVELMRRRLATQLQRARELDAEAFERTLVEEMEAEGGAEADALKQSVPPEQQYAGLKRHLEKSGG